MFWRGRNIRNIIKLITLQKTLVVRLILGGLSCGPERLLEREEDLNSVKRILIRVIVCSRGQGVGELYSSGANIFLLYFLSNCKTNFMKRKFYEIS